MSSELVGVGRAKALVNALSTGAVTQESMQAWMNDEAENGSEEIAIVLAEFSQKLDPDVA